MGYARSLIVGLIASQTIAVAAMAGGRTNASETSAVVHRQRENSSENRIKDNRVPAVTPLDRVATAVDGAESSHGTDIGMWRADPSGPQGPMQVSEAAATDAGGGDRFDLAQNRAIGRAYLAQLYKRYRNWPDAISAYNWSRDNMDAWVRAGRPPQEFLVGVAVYLRRVLHESGFCESSEVSRIGPKREAGSQPSPTSGYRDGEPECIGETVVRSPASLISAACVAPEAWLAGRTDGAAPDRFFKKLGQALQLAVRRARQEP
jgi:transglycosylase-like protein with SLT domain